MRSANDVFARSAEVEASPKRTMFAFGRNWKHFVNRAVGEDEVRQATNSLLRFLPREAYVGAGFLDIGCGSGLFSLGAAMLGCREVLSVDIDAEALEALQRLKERFAYLLPRESLDRWYVRRGDILDDTFVNATLPADIVYAWGVLHHTGHMRRAMENAGRLTRPGGQLILGIYNHAPSSEFWVAIKRFYSAHAALRPVLAGGYGALMVLATVLARGRLDLGRPRGMHAFYDAIDWIGGYPYEFACFEEIERLMVARGFMLSIAPTRLPCGRGHSASIFSKIRGAHTGCNELVLQRLPS